MTLMCSDDVILGIGIGYWYRWRPIVLGMLHGIILTLIIRLINVDFVSIWQSDLIMNK